MAQRSDPSAHPVRFQCAWREEAKRKTSAAGPWSGCAPATNGDRGASKRNSLTGSTVSISIGGIGVDGNRINYCLHDELDSWYQSMVQFWAGRSIPISASASARRYCTTAGRLGRLQVKLERRSALSPAHRLSGTWASSTTTQFGYQGIAGIRYNINPALAFDLDYRYFGTTEADFQVDKASGGGVQYKSGNSSHNVLACFVVRFGAPPPPPSWHRPRRRRRRRYSARCSSCSSIGTGTRSRLRACRLCSRRRRRSAPAGRSDPGHRLCRPVGLAGLQPAAVRAARQQRRQCSDRLGVPRQQMAVSGRGENDNRVPTADGVREPQNRRVEIVFP